MKIYTKTGDTGETGLLGKVRVSKASPRIEAIGSVDELNASLGVARATLANSKQQTANSGDSIAVRRLPLAVCDAWLATVQSHLFAIGAELAAPNGGHEEVSDEDVAALERQIDEWQAQLPELTRFILPGGSPVGAELHRARSVCRRAERAVVRLSEVDPDRVVRPELLRFLNRLSDALFAAARWANHLHGVAETPWERQK